MMDVVESWDGFVWIVRKGEKYEHDKIVLSRGEISVLHVLRSLSSHDKVLVDVGAHVGYYTCRLAKLYKHVHAFEPNPENRENLERNLIINGVFNVTVHPYALGDKNEVKKLYLSASSSTLLEGFPHHGYIDVEVKRMDDVISTADVVKIDVEGYELNVIKGMNRILLEKKPTLIVEHHDFRHHRTNTYKTIREHLEGMGYVHVYLTDPHRVYVHRTKGFEGVKRAIASCWINYCVKNIKEGREWYYGLPYDWWWGMAFTDFIFEIEEHVDRKDEPEWIKRLNEIS